MTNEQEIGEVVTDCVIDAVAGEGVGIFGAI